MEDEGDKGKSLKGILSSIPSWVQTALAIGGVVFSVGVVYNDVQTLKTQVDKAEGAQVQQAMLAGEISSLHVQIEAGNKTQEETNRTVNKLSDSVQDLGLAVSNLQGKLDQDNFKAKKK